PSLRPRWWLDARRAQYTFHCSLRVLLFVGDDACAHNLLLKGRPFIMRFQHLSEFDGSFSFSSYRPQLRVLRLVFFQDGNVGMGVFPERGKLGWPSLLRQPHLAHQLSKPGVGTQRVE